jgi:hypothetical protein
MTALQRSSLDGEVIAGAQEERFTARNTTPNRLRRHRSSIRFVYDWCGVPVDSGRGGGIHVIEVGVMSTPRRGRARFVVARVLVAVVSLSVAEVCLQIASRLSPAAGDLLGPGIDGTVRDPVLQYRGNPRYPEHDAAGYRNKKRLSQASVVVLGDSQVYGVGVSRDQAWPSLLQESLGASVYSMALPGYSPAEAWLQIDDAISLHPSRLVVSVYFGNDFVDAYKMAKFSSRIASLAPRDLFEKANAADAGRTIAEDGDALFNIGTERGKVPARVANAREWVASNIRLWGLARALEKSVLAKAGTASSSRLEFAAAVGSLSPLRSQYCLIVDQPGWRTILTPAYRDLVQNVADVRVRTGMEIVKAVLSSIAEKTRTADIQLLVVLTPTKELVAWPRTDMSDPPLVHLVADESGLRTELIDHMARGGIDYVDLLSPLRASRLQPYFEDDDGHPNQYGHRAIADAVASKFVAKNVRRNPG